MFNTTSHCLLTSIILHDKSAVDLVVEPLYWDFFFLACFEESLFVIVFCQLDCYVLRCGVHWDFILFGIHQASWICWLTFCIMFRKYEVIISSSYLCDLSPLPSASGVPIMHVFVQLMVSPSLWGSVHFSYSFYLFPQTGNLIDLS